MYVVKLKRRNEIAGDMWLCYTDIGHFVWINKENKSLILMNCFELWNVLDSLKIKYEDVEIQNMYINQAKRGKKNV